MLLAKTGKLAVVESFGEFDNVDRVSVEKLAQKCKVIFGSTNPRKLDPSFLRLGLLICNIRSSMHQANELLQYRTTVKKTFWLRLPTGFAVFSATHQQIHDLVASVNEWVYLQRQ